MKRFSYAFMFFLAWLPPSAQAQDMKIDINNYMFSPSKLTVAAGTKVTWINHDEAPHTIADKNKKFRSAALDTNESYSYTFTTPGTYQYFCTLHPQMVATVTVTAVQ